MAKDQSNFIGSFYLLLCNLPFLQTFDVLFFLSPAFLCRELGKKKHTISNFGLFYFTTATQLIIVFKLWMCKNSHTCSTRTDRSRIFRTNWQKTDTNWEARINPYLVFNLTPNPFEGPLFCLEIKYCCL